MTWSIDVSASGPSCKAGKGEAADCTITIADEDFQSLRRNPQANGMQLFFAGKLKVDGRPHARDEAPDALQPPVERAVQPARSTASASSISPGLLFGPFASLALADLGATVDKVEDAAGGDYLRLTPPLAATRWACSSRSTGRAQRVPRPKKAARAPAAQMVARIDVLFEQFRPG